MNRELALRIMASESRFTRRIVGRHLAEVLNATTNLAPKKSFVRVGFIRERPETTYLFLVFAPDRSLPREDSQKIKNHLLMAYCHVLAAELAEAKVIVGIAKEPAGTVPSSTTLCIVRTKDITEDFRVEGRRLQRELNLLVDIRSRLEMEHVTEYPAA